MAILEITQSPALAAATAVAALWFGWRIWRFTLTPSLNPMAPKSLPYLVPFFGHVVGASVNMSKLFTDALKYFGNTREPFSLTVLGNELYIITSPADILTVYKETTKLDYDLVASDFLKANGWTDTTANIMFTREGNGPSARSPMDGFHEDVKLQFLPGEKLDTLQGRFLKRIDDELHWDQIPPVALRSESTTGVKTVSLWHWCGSVLIETATWSVYGDELFRVFNKANKTGATPADHAPLTQTLLEFDGEAWKYHAKYPEFAAKKAFMLKDKIRDALTDFAALPTDVRSDSAWILPQLDTNMKKLDIMEANQRSAPMFSTLRLINANAFRHCFWCLAYLLHKPALWEEIKAEIAPAYRQSDPLPGTSLSMRYLNESCPLLVSFVEEVLRLTVAPIGARIVRSPCVVGGKTLQPGRLLLIPYRQNHFDPAVFGADAESFNPRRFMENKALARSTSWRPFGGGNSYCPGRYITRREVYLFMAVVLFRYDLRLVPGSKFPRLDESIASGSVLAPVPGDEVLVELRRA